MGAARSRRLLGAAAAALAVVLLLPGQAFADTVTFVANVTVVGKPVAMGGVLYFEGNSGYLWRSDGTAAGTVPVTTNVTVTNPWSLTAIGSTLWFGGQGANGAELWKSDGTDVGTTLVKDINPGPGSSNPDGFAAVDGVVYLSADDGTHGYELWRTDGTAAGTSMVADINPDVVPQLWTPRSKGSFPLELTGVDHTLFFTAYDGVSRQLWRSDGTAAGTKLVTLIAPVPPQAFYDADWQVCLALQSRFCAPMPYGAPSPTGLTTVGHTLFFAADDGLHGDELWKSDGTPTGTVMVKDINQATPYMASCCGGSIQLEAVRTRVTAPSSPRMFNVVGDNLYFVADGPPTLGCACISTSALWRSDGTDAGTTAITGIDGTVFGATHFDGGFLVSTFSGLYWNDGVRSAAVKLVSGSTRAITPLGRTAYFAHDDGVHGEELWKTDGTVAGTSLVQDINAGSASSSPDKLTNVNGVLYFTTYSPSGLWTDAP
jgi:ELWxxDGT repeat protein